MQSSIFLEEQRKTVKNLNKDNGYPSHDMK
jgi:hypothetical protein